LRLGEGERTFQISEQQIVGLVGLDPEPVAGEEEEDGISALDRLEERAEFLLERVTVLEIGDDLDVLLVEACGRAVE
jgi:hypothetical protein